MGEYVEKKYAALDALILDALNGRNLTFTSISVNLRIEEEAERVATHDPWGLNNGWRVVDRRLQALRKAGNIVYSRARGWERK